MNAAQLWLAQPPRVRLQQTGLVKGEYRLDLLHLNSAGYAALNQSLTPLLLDLAQAHRLQAKS